MLGIMVTIVILCVYLELFYGVSKIARWKKRRK